MPDYGPVTARLKHLREATDPKLSVRAIAELLGMPSSSYAFYEDPKGFKKSLLPVELAQQLAEHFSKRGVDRSLVLGLAGLNPEGAVQSGPDDLADQLDAVLLREIEVGYSMGGGSSVDDYPVVQMVPFSRAWLRSLTDSPASHLVVARGDGDSMMPTLLDDDRVIIDLSERRMTKQDRIWAVAYAGFGMIKRLRMLPNGTLQLNSDNASVSPIEAAEGEYYIIGRVCGIIRRI